MATQKQKCFLAVFLAICGVSVTNHAEDEVQFYACYTRLDYDQPQDPALLGQIPVNAAKVFADDQADKADQVPRPPGTGEVRWGKYADLVVNVAAGRRLVFARSSGYLPYYKTPNGKFPLKPLADCRPDPMCLCSYVRVVESPPERIVVHWRHVPDPASVVMTEVVHEYFAITPDGTVRREVRVGTTRLDDFNDPANVTVQQLRLTDDGVTELSLTTASCSIEPAPAVAGVPLRQPPVRRPAVWLRFDDGLSPNRDQTKEAVKGTICPVVGNKILWKQGVSGTALAFDGYFSKVTLPRAEAPRITDKLSLEAWVVLGAYPWNDAGIVHRSAGQPIDPEEYKHGYRDPYVYRPWKMAGYMLGIDPYGRAIFKISQWGAQEQSKHTADPFAGPWNHWPVGLNPSDGRYAVASDRITHAALGGARHTGDTILYGFTDQSAASLASLAKSWNHPPPVENVRGCESKGYDHSQRAYVLAATAKPILLTLSGSKDSPIHNPCFVIENWDSEAKVRVTIDGMEVQPGKALRQGVVYSPAGRRTKILFLDLQSEFPTDLIIREAPHQT